MTTHAPEPVLGLPASPDMTADTITRTASTTGQQSHRLSPSAVALAFSLLSLLLLFVVLSNGMVASVAGRTQR